ncbi:hypothetical protein NQ315_011244 [Exocentrus adspersus]|uniref:Uncharacterized protein n=1 Tax=Exocentrus adspersus TaxID=1586481 RepID=A0AAV8V8P9_9CUCU|nr:hypothetical protein NQ315_011244 [Exocentrus adspersus]
MNLVKMQESNCVPVAVFEEAQRAIFHLLPAKSREHYEKVFAEFNEWIEKRGVMTINEEVMLSYFLNLKKKYAVSSLWSKYSMLKATIKVYKNTDIGNYSKLTAYLKSESRGHKPKKAAILERAHNEEFLTRTCDKEYLMIKVALIMGISGACRCCELTNLKSTDVKDAGSYLLVSIPDTKAGISRKFTIIEEGFCVNAIEICRKYYIPFRPIRLPQDRFFLRYMNQKCTCQPVGINTLAKVPSIVASFLNLPNAEL